MKKIYLYLLFCGVSLSAYSQDYLDSIADNACSCAEKTPELLGFCIINAVSEFPEEVKRDFGIDVISISDGSPNELVPIIAAKMSGICPNALAAAQEIFSDELTDEGFEEEEIYFGTISKSSTDGFLSYFIENEEGEVRRFLILGQIDCNCDIEKEFKSLVKKSVEVVFISIEIFDPNKGKYITSSIITSMNVL